MSSSQHGGNHSNAQHESDDSWDYPFPTAEEARALGAAFEQEYPFAGDHRHAKLTEESPSEWGDSWTREAYPPSSPVELGYPPSDAGTHSGHEPPPAVGHSRQSLSTSSGQPGTRSARPASPPRPLNVVCVGPTFRVGGVRQHALALAKFLDPARACITEFIVTEQSRSSGQHDQPMPAAVTLADASTFDRVSRECDVMLMWGAGYNGRIPNGRSVRVFLAHGESWWTRNALEESSHVVDHVIAVSEQVRRSICNGFPATTILNGVDTARLGQTASRQELRRRFAFAENDFVVGSIGRFTREKQFHLLMESLARLPERFKLLLVGSGPRQSELLDFANRHIPGRFAIVSASDYLGDYYAAMDAFGLVSAHEGFGLVLAEAMMCGRPVISTKVGCAQEVILDRINGLLVDHNPESIALAFQRLQEYPRWARGLASEGQHFANTHLHAARMAREYEDLLLTLHAARQCHRGANR